MSGSFSSASSGPRPKISCRTSVMSASRSNRLSGVVWLSRSSSPRIRPLISGSASSRSHLREPFEIQPAEQLVVDASLELLVFAGPHIRASAAA